MNRVGIVRTSAVVRMAWPSSLTMMVPKTPCVICTQMHPE